MLNIIHIVVLLRLFHSFLEASPRQYNIYPVLLLEMEKRVSLSKTEIQLY